jgi:hypothetical protein
MKNTRWIGFAAASLLLALPALAQTARVAPRAEKEDKDVKRKTVVVRGDQVEVFGDEGGPRTLVGLSGGYLGIAPVALTEDLRTHFGVSRETGVMIGDVFDDTPAARAGLRVGDIITQVDGKDVRSTFDITRALSSKKKGDQVRVDFVRDRAAQHAFVSVDERRGATAFRFAFPDVDVDDVLIDREQIESAMEGWRRLAPEARPRVMTLGGDCQELQGRIQELETRLKELEKKLK